VSKVSSRPWGSPAKVTPPRKVRFLGDDCALVQALVSGHPGAPAELFDRYGSSVQRLLTHVLGFDAELPDLLHEVFARALQQIAALEDGDRLRGWLASIAVFTARSCIRTRRRWRWLMAAPDRVADRVPAPGVPDEVREAVRCTYEVLDRMRTEQRLTFALRYIDGLGLADLAEVLGVSLATAKRRLSRAEKRFLALAARRPTLRPWIEEGKRWGTR
jgi:RNA polymerase sigma-70 factor, ECF subfamily